MIPILTTTSTVMCPHGGQLQLSTTNTDAVIDGAPALLVTDVHPVAACPFTIGPKPQPCVTARWMAGATHAKVHGVPLLLQNSVGVCFSAEQIPAGPPVVVQVQQLAKAI
jgi:hypothetical protein